MLMAMRKASGELGPRSTRSPRKTILRPSGAVTVTARSPWSSDQATCTELDQQCLKFAAQPCTPPMMSNGPASSRLSVHSGGARSRRRRARLAGELPNLAEALALQAAETRRISLVIRWITWRRRVDPGGTCCEPHRYQCRDRSRWPPAGHASARQFDPGFAICCRTLVASITVRIRRFKRFPQWHPPERRRRHSPTGPSRHPTPTPGSGPKR